MYITCPKCKIKRNDEVLECPICPKKKVRKTKKSKKPKKRKKYKQQPMSLWALKIFNEAHEERMKAWKEKGEEMLRKYLKVFHK